MIVKTVITSADTWYNLPTPQYVETLQGPKLVDKFYFNGYHDTFEITLYNVESKNEYVFKGTPNHQLMLDTGQWSRLDEIEDEVIMGGWVIKSIEVLDVAATMDMEVPDVHHYILENGIPSHNTASIMGGVSQGIEPMIGNCFVAQLAGGDEIRVNPAFLELMKKHGKYTKKLVKEIADNHGSVQNLDWLTDHEKLVFRTAYEINQETILNQASVRQRHLCQGQSLNLFFSADEDEKYIAYIHKKAIKDEWINALYYLRSEAGVEASKGCIACT